MTFFALARSPERRHASQAAGFVAVTIAAGGAHRRVGRAAAALELGSGVATTKPVAILRITALGLALVHPGRNSRFALAVGLAVAAIAVLDLFGPISASTAGSCRGLGARTWGGLVRND